MSKITQFPSKKSDFKRYEGFEYVKFIKDTNGITLKAEHLRDYAEKNRYIITVMRTLNGTVCLYNFFVKNSELPKFIKCYFDGKIEGEIIEIEKQNPEILA